MPRPKSAPTATPAAELAECVQKLTEQMHHLSGHIEVLYQVLDEIRDDFSWALKNGRLRCPRPLTHVTSMPQDSCAPDFYERLNRFTATNLPMANVEQAAPTVSASSYRQPGEEQPELWD